MSDGSREILATGRFALIPVAVSTPHGIPNSPERVIGP
jgi:hypothetical protein